MSPVDELRTAARALRDSGHGGWYLDVARWLERAALHWNTVVDTTTRQAVNERKDALATARSINTDSPPAP